MNSFSLHSDKTGVTTLTRTNHTTTIKHLIGFPAAILRCMIHAVKMTGNSVLPTEDGTYIVLPIPGEESVLGVRHES